MDVVVWFDPETGEAELGSESRDPPGGHWKVMRKGVAVSLLGRNEKNKVVLIGSGTWSGKGIKKRYAVDEPIDNGTWAKVESSLHRLGQASNEHVPESRRPLVEYQGPEGVMPGAHANIAEPETAQGAGTSKDSRSGWWAFGAFAAAAIGFVIALVTYDRNDTVSLVIAITLGVGAGGLLIYLLYGLGTRCPGCKAWYRRETTSTETLGTSTTTRSVSIPIKDSSGKQTGSRTEMQTFEVTRYRYNYRCKECSHRWTGTGSSERRIS